MGPGVEVVIHLSTLQFSKRIQRRTLRSITCSFLFIKWHFLEHSFSFPSFCFFQPQTHNSLMHLSLCLFYSFPLLLTLHSCFSKLSFTLFKVECASFRETMILYPFWYHIYNCFPIIIFHFFINWTVQIL